MTQGQIWKIPENYDKVSIFGEPEVRRSQAIALLTLYNPQLPIKATPEEIVDAYYEEASREGIRWILLFRRPSLKRGSLPLAVRWYRNRTISAAWAQPVRLCAVLISYAKGRREGPYPASDGLYDGSASQDRHHRSPL